MDRIMFKGIMPALITPVNDDGSIREKATRDLIADLSTTGITGFYILGSTGEGVLVTCRNFFGKLSLFRAYDGKTIRCTVQDQDAFLQQVYDIISSDAP